MVPFHWENIDEPSLYAFPVYRDHRFHDARAVVRYASRHDRLPASEVIPAEAHDRGHDEL